MTLFFIALSVLFVAVMGSWRVRNQARHPRERQGPVPGYSMTHGREAVLQPADFEFSDIDWSIRSIETYNSAERTRLIVTLESATLARLDILVHVVAQAFQRIAKTQVIVVEAIDENGRAILQHLYAPDGHGWTGGEAIRSATLDHR